VASVVGQFFPRSLPCARHSQQTSMVRVPRRPLSAFRLRAAIQAFRALLSGATGCTRPRREATRARAHQARRSVCENGATRTRGYRIKKILSEPRQYRCWFGNCESERPRAGDGGAARPPEGGFCWVGKFPGGQGECIANGTPIGSYQKEWLSSGFQSDGIGLAITHGTNRNPVPVEIGPQVGARCHGALGIWKA
jgi:hypothetical protein